MPEQPLSSDPQSTFGPNEWLVDELYESYLKDRNSVDKAWWDFFKDYEPGEATYGRDYAVKSNHTPAAATSAQGNGAAPKAAPAAPADPAPAGQPATSAAKPAPAAPAAAPVTKEGPTPKAKAAPVTTPTPNPTKEPGTPSNPSAPMPRDMDKPKTQAAQSEGENLPIRGASARVVTNMEASLAVPTATSVRAVPAKLLIDNRVVINNHLARSRGGKVSFTHIIGYALVKALKAMPEMNYGFGHDDSGKPVLHKPAHVNLGLAIDLAKPDGTRQLLVPSIKGAEGMDFAHFWTAYEEIVKKARGGKLEVADFQGTTISLTNHRNRALGAAAHAGPGHDHRRRGARVPRRVAGREQRDAQPQCRVQGPHDHVDL